jgi:hypothetical protein
MANMNSPSLFTQEKSDQIDAAIREVLKAPPGLKVYHCVILVTVDDAAKTAVTDSWGNIPPKNLSEILRRRADHLDEHS